MKKLLSLLLAFAMVATLFVAIPATVSAGGTNVGKVEDGYTPAEGSIGISSAEGFATMEAGKNYHLTADITIDKTWNAGADVTANTGNTVFTGTFDGNGHKVTISAPMFAQIGGTVKNLTIEGSVETTLYAGAVSMYAKSAATFENIYNKANVSGNATGALIGRGETGCNITAKNCLNEGNMTGTAQTGGFFGYIQDDVVTVTNCVNTGFIKSESSYCGGIIGRFGRDKAAAPDSVIVIDNCENYGKIYAGTGQVGGMLGLFVGVCTVTNCNNYGELEAKGMAAGIVGSSYIPEIDGADVAKICGLTIDRCVNYGKVTGTTVVAGIVARNGRNANHADFSYRITNCENHGDLYANISGTTTYYVGGIAGYAYGGSANSKGVVNAVSNNINTGDIHVSSTSTKAQHISGVLGYVNSSVYELKNNVNLGKVYIEQALVSGSMLSLTVYNKSAASPNVGNNYSIDEFYVAGVKTAVNKATLGSADCEDHLAKIITAEQVASGELAYLANQGAGENVFFQNLTEAPIDTHPTVFAADDGSNIVIKNGDAYTNPSTDFSAINAKIEAASQLVETDYSANWAEFLAALEAAKTVAANASAKQTDVDAAIIALDNAINALVTKKFAKIGDVEYTSLEAAIEAAQAGDTIVLLDNIVAKATVTVNKSVTIDGNGKSITSDGFNAIDVSGSSITVTIKNLTVNTDKQGINAVACTGEETRSTLNVNNCTINATGTAKTDAGINFFAYWNVNVNGCTIVSANRGIYADGDGRNNTVIKNCNITANTSNGYGIYAQEGSTLEVSDTTIAVNGQSGIQSITASKELGTTVTLKNVTVNATDAYCIAVNPNNSYYVEDGSYISKNKDAAINVFGYGAYMKISGDAYVESNKNCAVRAYISGDANVYGQDGNAVLDIEGGTFVLTATNGGSALRAGTGDKGQSTINIKGGKFITYGTGPVINYVRADSTVNITGGTFENKGDAEIAVVANAADPNFVTVNFPAGVKLVEYRDGEFVDPNAVPEETTTEEVTTAPIEPDVTTPEVTEPDVTTPEATTPEVTTPELTEPEVTTPAEPDDPIVGDSIDTILLIALVSALMVGCVFAVLVIRRKKEND